MFLIYSKNIYLFNYLFVHAHSAIWPGNLWCISLVISVKDSKTCGRRFLFPLNKCVFKFVEGYFKKRAVSDSTR